MGMFGNFFGGERNPEGARPNDGRDFIASPGSPNMGDVVPGEAEAAEERAERIAFLDRRISELELQIHQNGEDTEVNRKALESFINERQSFENPLQ
jgi:hypothetical protein